MAQTIRTAVEQDLDAIAAVEAECFPVAEAATRAEFAERLRYYGNHFWLLWEDETLAAFVDGMVTDAADLTDAMYADASLHNENGAWQMIFGRKGLVLTCKDKLVHYYARFGFVSEGVSGSTHGGVTWYQMRLTF